MEFLQYTGLEGYFSAIACADEVKQGKPYPDLVLAAADKMNLRPGDCIMLSDSVGDMEMGRTAGMRCVVGVLRGSATREDLEPVADIIIPGVALMAVQL